MSRTRYEYTSVPKGTGLAPSRRGLTKGVCWTHARLKASVDKLVQHVYRRPLCVGRGAPGGPWEYVGSALPNGGTYKAQAGDGKALWLLQKLQEELDCVPAGTLAFWDRGRVDGLKAAIDLVHRAFGIG